MDGQRIVEARKAKGWSQQDLANELGTSQATIQRYESGNRDPKSGVVVALSAALGVTVSYLLGVSDDPYVITQAPSSSRPMPVVGRIAAGTPREAIGLDGETHDIPESLWRDHKRAFWLTVAGNSMNRLFAEGTLVLIDPDEEVRNGDVAVVFVNGDDATLKRVFFEGDVIRLHPESYDPDYRDRVIDKSDPDAPSVRVLGKAVSFTAPDGWRA